MTYRDASFDQEAENLTHLIDSLTMSVARVIKDELWECSIGYSGPHDVKDVLISRALQIMRNINSDIEARKDLWLMLFGEIGEPE